MLLTRQESARAKLLPSVRLYSRRKTPCLFKSVQPHALNPKHLRFKCFANVNATVERPVPQSVDESLLSYDKEEYADPPTFITTDGRVVAVGDLHGDYQKTIECLTASKVISINSDNTIHWIGKNTVVVQLGDVLGRGPDEICILQLLRYLDACARREGGAVYMLNGNHEFMNVCGSFKYVHNLALQESGRFAGVPDEDLHRSSVLVEAPARLF
uniref:Calcineurin-like phosphoesterase domain-containing protein n=1 Tax=Polytomella parva TaxID=51329 RepID=A0A7S0YMK0_9CHLO|mmetsp:Transcript_33399/g.60344  ORF Transcript_33399/g.60344 Transcript_33399/m.60344 type:complete len:214 (+) Transcript_33399:63-704(+)